MKRKLLLICVCLFAALNGVKAWTSVTPQVGKSYYLHCTVYPNQFWYADKTNDRYCITSDLSVATPVYIESITDGTTYAMSFYVNGTKYYLHQHNEALDWPTSSSTMNVEGTTSGYCVRNDSYKGGWLNSKSGHRYMWPSASESVITWGKVLDEDASPDYCWQFIACEEAMTYMSTFCAGVAGANYVQSVKGWQRVTSISELQTNPEDYFFAIFSANAAGLMVQTDASTGYGYYLNGTNPLSNSAYLFNIENYSYNSEDYFVMKAGNTNAYYHAENNAAYDLVAKDQPLVDDDCRLVFEYADNAWNIKTWTSFSGDPNSGSYWGLWTPGEGYMNGKKMAGNKNDDEKGSFLIYRIPRYKLDMTSRITNPSFETDEDGHEGATGWTLGSTNNDTKVHVNSNPTYTMSNVDGYKLFNTWDGDGTGYTISQTLSNMPAGVYKLTAVMGAFEGQTLQLIANDVTGTAPSEGKETGVKVTTYVILASPGNLTIRAKTAASAFYKVDDFRLTYLGGMEDLTPVSGNMNAAVNTEQQNAVSLYNSNKTVANYIAAMDAIAAAVESIDIYSTISGIMTTYQGKAEALDAAGQAAYTSAINTASTGAKSKYNDGTYTTAAEAETAFSNTYIAAVKAQVTAGADMTDAIINPSFETGNISPWTSADGGGVASNNNWSSGKVGTYFVERWQTSASGGLSNGTLTQTLTGMPAGRYTLTANAQNIEQQNASAHGRGYFLTLGSAQTEVTSEILTTVTFDLAEAGNLTIGMKLESCTGNWVSCDNFRLTYVGIQKNVTVAAKAGKYGTTILPFTYNFASDGDFSNIKFYSCASVNNGYTQIEEVSTPEANTPYIIKNNGREDLNKPISGFSVAVQNSYTAGLLTGVYTEATIDANANNYVLQTHDDGVQAFYLVKDEDFTATPYKCYLTIPTDTPVKAFLFPENPTAINAIETAENENTEIYNLAGQRMSKVQKGVNIINGKKVLVK